MNSGANPIASGTVQAFAPPSKQLPPPKQVLPEALANPDNYNRPELIDAQRTALNAMAQAVAAGDEDSLDLLVNLSLVDSRHGPSNVAREAIQRLLDISRALRTEPGVRQAIRQKAVLLCEAGLSNASHQPPVDSKAGAGTKASADPKTRFRLIDEIPAALLYLAACEAPGRAPELSAQLRQRIDPHNTNATQEPPSETCSPGRFISTSELLAATGPNIAEADRLPVHDVPLDVSPAPEGTEVEVVRKRQLDFDSTLRSLMDAARKDAKPRAVFINTGAHWVTMVVCPRKADAGFDSLIFNSRLAKPDVDLERIQSALGASDAWKAMAGTSKPRYGALPLQSVDNLVVGHGCGAFAVMTVETLRACLAQNSEAGIEQLVASLHSFTDDWIKRSATQAQAHQEVMLAQRAHILGKLAHQQARLQAAT